jgi:Predicted transcriptional regulators
MNTLHPTLWRTCRVLANVRRLQCLKAVLCCPDATVGQVAETCKFPVNQTSVYLRALQTRGLLQSVRDSRWVHYRPQPDPLVPSAEPVLSAVTRAFLKDNMPVKDIIFCLTAFTHPRRLVILSVLLQHESISFMELSRKSNVSPCALTRHLAKLCRRNMTAKDGEERCAVLRPPSLLAAALLRLLRPSST